MPSVCLGLYKGIEFFLVFITSNWRTWEINKNGEFEMWRIHTVYDSHNFRCLYKYERRRGGPGVCVFPLLFILAQLVFHFFFFFFLFTSLRLFFKRRMCWMRGADGPAGNPRPATGEWARVLLLSSFSLFCLPRLFFVSSASLPLGATRPGRTQRILITLNTGVK